MQRMQRKQKLQLLRLNQKLTKKKLKRLRNKLKQKAALFRKMNLTPPKNKSSALHHHTPRSTCVCLAQAEYSKRSAPPPDRRFYYLQRVLLAEYCPPLLLCGDVVLREVQLDHTQKPHHQ